MNHLKTISLIAGILYLIIILCGLTAEFFFRMPVMELISNGKELSQLIQYYDGLLMSLLLDLLMIISDVAIAILLLFLFKDISFKLIILSSAFRLIQASVLSANLLNFIFAVRLLEKSPEQAVQYLLLHSTGYDLGLVFFAFTCLFQALILLKNKFSTFIGIGLVLSSIIYFTGSLIALIAPNISPEIELFYLIPIITEISFCIWLFRQKKVHQIAVKA